MPDAGKLAAVIDDIRKRYEVWGDASDVPRLLAVVDAVLALADSWKAKAAELWQQVADQNCEGASAGFKGIGASLNGEHADALREAVSRELLEEGTP